MKTKETTTVIALWANRAVAALLIVLLFTLPMLLDWYCQYRVLSATERVALMAAFYSCFVIVAVALWNLEGLLRSILCQQVFTRRNVRRIRVIQWCCAGVGLICIPAAFCYYPLVFMVIIMGFLSLIVTVLTRVMDTAVAIREENDLTI